MQPSLPSITLLTLGLVLAPTLAAAAPSVAAGEAIAFTQGPDGGATECRIEDEIFDCDDGGLWKYGLLGPRTSFDVDTRQLHAVISPDVSLTPLLAHHASASVFNDFRIPGPDGLVMAHVSVTFDHENELQGASAYTVEAGVSLTLSDVTATPVVIASVDLVNQDRSGDQGATDVAGGFQRSNLNGEGSGLTVLLQRGHTYRITFQANAAMSSLATATNAILSSARWSNLRVHLDEDEVELLGNHDAEVKAALAQHDMDIKALLRNIEAGQQEIIRLLLTPQGRRQSDFGSNCESGGCDFPLRPSRDARTRSERRTR